MDAFAAAGGDTMSPYAIASAVPTPALTMDTASYLSTFPDARAAASAGTTSAVASAQPAPAFRSLYQGGDRPQPISPTVQELWGSSSALTTSATPKVRAPGRLDLFSDPNGTYSSSSS